MGTIMNLYLYAYVAGNLSSNAGVSGEEREAG